jgi:hypothetical protein
MEDAATVIYWTELLVGKYVSLGVSLSDSLHRGALGKLFIPLFEDNCVVEFQKVRIRTSLQKKVDSWTGSRLRLYSCITGPYA